MCVFAREKKIDSNNPTHRHDPKYPFEEGGGGGTWGRNGRGVSDGWVRILTGFQWRVTHGMPKGGWGSREIVALPVNGVGGSRLPLFSLSRAPPASDMGMNCSEASFSFLAMHQSSCLNFACVFQVDLQVFEPSEISVCVCVWSGPLKFQSL